MSTTAKNTQPLHEIRKDGKTLVSWRDPSCGYPPETLRAMKANGYRLYIDGKLQR